MLVGHARSPGPAWVWVLPVALAGQCLLLAVYSELASEFPIAGGAYQWSRRLIGGAYGWFTGWVAICAYAAANTTVAYLGAPWALTLLDIEPTPERDRAHRAWCWSWSARWPARSASACSSRAVKAGIAAEVVASVGIGLALLLVFREQDFSILTDTLGAEALSGGSVAAGAARRARRRRLGVHRLRLRASAPPRRPRTPRATSRARSGSRC